MRRLLISLSALAAALVVATGPAFADSPHFIRADATGPAADGTLATTFKISGLGDTIATTVTASADATATYACRNNGGNFPSDPKKTDVAGPVQTSGDFTSGRNGQVTGALTVAPPPSGLDCPPGQHEVLVFVGYSGVQVSEPAAGDESIPGVFERVFFEL